MKKRTSEQRKTIAYFPSSAVAPTPGLYGHMFVEDICSGLMPFRRISGDDESQRADVDADEPGKVALNAICTSLADYPGYEVGETALAAVEAIAKRLAWFGQAVYEVCGAGDDMALEGVPPFRLFRIPGGFVQLVPKSDWQFFNGRRYTFLRADRAWVVSLPPELDGPRGHRRLLRRLNAVSQPAPGFWTRELEAGKLSTEFIFEDYDRLRDAYIARVTRHWGWNRRDSTSKHDTEFFYFLRSLRFRQSQAILRSHIVQEMNNFLLRQSHPRSYPPGRFFRRPCDRGTCTEGNRRVHPLRRGPAPREVDNTQR